MSDIVKQEEVFSEFPKLARLSREVVITEKIDGTNAQICITDYGDFLIGSRSQWITTQNDNHGFARWATEHKDELMTLGPGKHFGEWWGSGIERGYGLTKGEKRFSLFNVIRWCLHDSTPLQLGPAKYQEKLPDCCDLVPILSKGIFSTTACDGALDNLRIHGSYAAPSFMKPEGIVCFHIAGNVGFKKTIEKDETPKSLQN